MYEVPTMCPAPHGYVGASVMNESLFRASKDAPEHSPTIVEIILRPIPVRGDEGPLFWFGGCFNWMAGDISRGMSRFSKWLAAFPRPRCRI